MILGSKPPPDVKIDDLVTVIQAPGTSEWRVLGIHDKASANGPLYALRSEQTGQRRYELLDNIAAVTPDTPRRITG